MTYRLVPGIAVTREQAEAAELEVQAMRSAGLEPDPVVVQLAGLASADAPAVASPAPDAPPSARGEEDTDLPSRRSRRRKAAAHRAKTVRASQRGRTTGAMVSRSAGSGTGSA